MDPNKQKIIDDIFGGAAPASTPNIEAGRARTVELKALRQSYQEDQSAQSSGALFPAKTGESVGQAGLKAIGNVPSSVFNLGKNLVKAVTHPTSTVKGIGDALGGGIREGIEKIIKKQLPENEDTAKMEDTFNAVTNSLRERYGSLDAAQRTATNDPFGFGADVMSILSGGAGLAKEIPGVAKLAETVTEPITAVRNAGRAKIADVFEKGAQKSLSKVLAPTKDALKVQTEQILPELATRNKIAFTRKGLSEKYASEMDASGQAIDEAWAKLPAGTTEEIKPIVDALEESKNKFVVNGTVVEPDAFKAADELQKIVLDVSKGEDRIPSESLRKVRQIWDESIAKSKGFTRDLSDQDKLNIKKEATGAIRKVLTDAHPDIALLNKEYTLWKKATDILDETIKRKTGQGVGLGTKTLMAGGIGGGSASAGLKGAAIGAGAVAAVTLAMKSTLWKTLAAAAKSKIASSLIEANPAELKKILVPIIGEQAIGLIDESKD